MRLAVCFFFFFQAEDGIRDVAVTGVQTCALPISSGMTVELFPVTPRLLSSTPSTVKLLSRGRVPPTDPPIPVTPPGCAITLGASTARFSMLPFREIGRAHV